MEPITLVIGAAGAVLNKIIGWYTAQSMIESVLFVGGVTNAAFAVMGLNLSIEYKMWGCRGKFNFNFLAWTTLSCVLFALWYWWVR